MSEHAKLKTLVLLNGGAGTLMKGSATDAAATIRDRFASHGIDADVREVPGDQLDRVTRDACAARTHDLIIAGGGDGTLNTIASAMVGSDIAYGVLPLGTFNHFAKELKIPLDLNEAIDALATGETISFPIGRVNDRHFLLFCAIGLYTDMVRHRDAQREALGRRKMWAGLIALVKMVVRWPLMRVRLSKIEGPSHADLSRLTSTVYVSLSGFQMEQMGLADVPSAARDALTVLLSPHVKRRSFVAFLIKAMFKRVSSWRDLDRFHAQRLEMNVHRRATVRVGYDGEVETMQTPLKIERMENALRVRVPAAYLASRQESVRDEATPVSSTR